MSEENQPYEPEQAENSLTTAASDALERVAEDRLKARPQVRRLLDELKVRLFDPDLNVTKLLEVTNMPSGSIQAAFHDDTGQSVLEYIAKARLEIALMLLLSSKLEVTDIAHMSGFSDRFHLNRTTKRWLGMSPQEIRKRWHSVLGKTRQATVQFQSRQIWRALQAGTLERNEASELKQFFEQLYPETARITSLRQAFALHTQEKIDHCMAEAIWESIGTLPPAKQETFVEQVIRSKSLALFNLLGQKSLEQCRWGRGQRGVELAQLALRLLEGSGGLLGEDRTAVELLGRARLANALRLSGDFHQAESIFASIEQEWNDLCTGNARIEAEILALKASLRLYQHRFTEARALLNDAIIMCRENGPSRLLAQCLIQRASINGHIGDPKARIPDLVEALVVLRDVKDSRLDVIVTNNLANSYLLIGDCREAMRLLQEAKDKCAVLGDELIKRQQQWLEGLIMKEEGELNSAERLFEKARTGLASLCRPGYAAMAALELAMIRHQQGRHLEVTSLTGEIVPVFEHFRIVPGVVACLKLVREALAADHVNLTILEKVREQLYALWRDPSIDLGKICTERGSTK